MSFGVCLIVILVWSISIRDFLHQPFRCGVVRTWVIWSDRYGTDNYFSAIGLQERHLFATDFVRHHKNTFITPLSGNYRQTHPRVTRCWLDNCSTWLEEAGLFSLINHCERWSIFRTTTRISRFKFCNYRTRNSIPNSWQPNQRCFSDEVKHRVGNV